MINEEKVLLMSQASLYESREKKKSMKIMKYFRHDYISLNLLIGWFFITLCFCLFAALWGACNMEYLLDNINTMDLKSLGTTLALIYVLVVAVYGGALYVVYAYRYYRAKKSVNTYNHTLHKISAVYAAEGKGRAARSRTEGVRDDTVT